MLAGTRDVPQRLQLGTSVSIGNVEPARVGYVYEKMGRAVISTGHYFEALCIASVSTVLRAMYDEVKERDEQRRDDVYFN